MVSRDDPRRDAAAALRAGGRRVTSQRLRILEALLALPGHQTVEVIHAWAQKREPALALSTVYRTLEALAAVGVVASFDEGAASTRYEWVPADATHHHLICRHCGQHTEVEVEAVRDLKREVERRYGFAADIRHLAISGACEACRDLGG